MKLKKGASLAKKKASDMEKMHRQLNGKRSRPKYA